jgi:hypothetical protein
MSEPVRKYTWVSGVGHVPIDDTQEVKRFKDSRWTKAFVDPSLKLAQNRKNALLAVVTIVRDRHFRNRGKPFPLGNLTMQGLGFDRRDKIKALRQLEEEGLIQVEWRDRKSPIITVPKTF